MNILLVSFLYEPEIGGGAALVVHQLAHALAQRSHSVVVITTWKGDHVKTDNVDGIKIIRIPPCNLYWVGEKDDQPLYKKIIWQMIDTWNPLVFQTMKRIISDEKPDVVHIHKLRGISPSVWSAAKSVGVKRIVHTCHDFEMLSPEGLFMGRVGKLARQQNVLMRPYQALRRNLSKSVNIATAPSHYVMDIHQGMGFFPMAGTRIIHNTHGFSEQEIYEMNVGSNTKNNRSKTGYRFLYLGRLDKAKGVDILCQAFIQAASLNPKIVLKVAGWGAMEGYLRETYSRENNIKFLGKVFGKQKEGLFKNSDVLIVPSIAPESFGLVVVEAYAHGLPVITSQAGAFPEIVKEGITGLMAAAGSVSALSTAIVRLSEDPSLVMEMSRNCREEAKKYSSDNFINEYLDVYQGIL
jgi:glycosyltransferase involved in cell wall biosynthesis